MMGTLEDHGVIPLTLVQLFESIKADEVRVHAHAFACTLHVALQDMDPHAD